VKNDLEARIANIEEQLVRLFRANDSLIRQGREIHRSLSMLREHVDYHFSRMEARLKKLEYPEDF
jgi:hypothetical protein